MQWSSIFSRGWQFAIMMPLNNLCPFWASESFRFVPQHPANSHTSEQQKFYFLSCVKKFIM